MKVLLADDHAIMRQGLRALLEKNPQIQIIGEASDGREAVRLTEKLLPELVIMDIAMPGLNGLDALIQIRQFSPQVKVIILSMHIEDDYLKRALRGGAAGFVYKGSAFDDLDLAMKAVDKGEVFLSPAVSQILVDELLLDEPREKGKKLLDRLSLREREILQLITEGKSRSQIADTLSISVKTVDRHRDNLKDKLGVKTEESMIATAEELGFNDY